MSGRLVGGGGDPLGLVWFLAWLPHALGHGESPLFTTALMAPGGANLLNSTSIPLPSLLLWPITAIGGPVLSYDALATLAIALSAWTAYFAMLRITSSRSIAWIGGAIYGFGGYMTGQAAAHANLLVAVFPPLVIILLDDVRRGRSVARTGALLGLGATAQVFINEEILATTAIMAVLGLAFGILIYRPQWALARQYVRAGALATVIFAVLAGPALGYQFFGPEHVRGVIVSSGRYVNDLLGFFVPNALDRLSTGGSRHLTNGFSGYDGEFGAYLGVPLVLLLVLAGWRLKKRALLAGLLLVTAAVLSLGPHLRINGADSGILLPWAVPGHLPLLENIVPARFNLFVWLAAAVLIVLLIDDLQSRPLLGSEPLGVIACALALIPALPARTASEVPRVPAVVESAMALRRLAPGASTVLIVPSSNGQLGMYAQAEADFSYRIPDGGVFVPTADGPSYGMRHGPLLYALAALGGHDSTRAGRTPTDARCLQQLKALPAPTGACRTHYRRAVRALRVDAVVVSRLSSRSTATRDFAFFTSLLGAPRPESGAGVFIVQPRRRGWHQ